MADDLQTRFDKFFQAFWLKPTAAASDRLFLFTGTATSFWVVIRKASDGSPLTTFQATLSSGEVQLDLAEWVPNGQNITLALFGSSAQADQYYSESAGGWTTAEQAVIDDTDTFQMIPDVNFTPQQEVRAARDGCDPGDPTSVAAMNAKLVDIYAAFSSYNGLVTPALGLPGLKGLLIGAPGDPGEWVPP